jgi:hypothetical protein
VTTVSDVFEDEENKPKPTTVVVSSAIEKELTEEEDSRIEHTTEVVASALDVSKEPTIELLLSSTSSSTSSAFSIEVI